MFYPIPGTDPIVADVKRAYLGPNTGYTIYFGELYGLLIALKMAAADDNNAPVIIFTDNHAAIRSIHEPRKQSDQYMLTQIVHRLRSINKRMEIHWIPAHTEVSGNEEADIAAKEATDWRQDGSLSCTAPSPPNLLGLIAAARTLVTRKTNRD